MSNVIDIIIYVHNYVMLIKLIVKCRSSLLKTEK